MNLLDLPACSRWARTGRIVSPGLFLRAFALAACSVWASLLAQRGWTLGGPGKTLSAPDERSSAFVDTSVGQSGTKGARLSDGRVLGRQEGSSARAAEPPVPGAELPNPRFQSGIRWPVQLLWRTLVLHRSSWAQERRRRKRTTGNYQASTIAWFWTCFSKVLGHVESQRWGWRDEGSGPFRGVLLFNWSVIKASLVRTKDAFREF